MNGYAGQTVFINLGLKTIKYYETSQYTEWIGGRGFCALVLWEQVLPGLDPLHPDNPIVISTGPLTGTPAPGASRFSIGIRNIITGGISYSSAGGMFGPELKSAGIDNLVIIGSSKKPVYLLIKDGLIEIKDASVIWGKTTWETEEIIRKVEKDPQIRVLSIGPAGENLVTFSCLITERSHAAGWGGSGALMGSKNLKAIAARGKRIVQVLNPEALTTEIKRITWKINASEALAGMRRVGTHGMSSAGGLSGLVPTAVHNQQDEFWPPENNMRVSEKEFKKWETGRTGCFACQINCLHIYSFPDKGKKRTVEGLHANSVRGFSSNWGVTDPEIIMKAHMLCNENGIDVDGLSAVVAWAIECYERGIISDSDTDGLRLNWGNGASIISLIEKIIYRENLGDVLAKGVYAAAEMIGRGSEQFVMQVKKTGINEQAIRSHKAWALGIGVSTRGAGHLGGSPITEQRRISPEVGQLIFRVPDAGNPTSYQGKARLVKWYENYKVVIDSLGVCYFNFGWYDVSLADPADLEHLLRHATGLETTAEKLMSFGEKIINLEKAFNIIHAGLTSEDDWLPDRFYDSEVSSGAFAGAKLSREKWGEMLKEYYELHGWDSVSGFPKEEVMSKLGLKNVWLKLNEHNEL